MCQALCQVLRVQGLRTQNPLPFCSLQPRRRMKETNTQSVCNASDRDRIRRKIRQDKEIASDGQGPGLVGLFRERGVHCREVMEAGPGDGK